MVGPSEGEDGADPEPRTHTTAALDLEGPTLNHHERVSPLLAPVVEALPGRQDDGADSAAWPGRPVEKRERFAVVGHGVAGMAKRSKSVGSPKMATSVITLLSTVNTPIAKGRNSGSSGARQYSANAG